MTAEGDLGDGGEVADAALAPPRHEGGLGVAHVGGDPLHAGAVEPSCGQQDPRGLPPEETRENAAQRWIVGVECSVIDRSYRR